MEISAIIHDQGELQTMVEGNPLQSEHTNMGEPECASMNLIIWNCNGAVLSLFLYTIRDVIGMHSPNILGLLEPKTSAEQAD